MRLRRPGIDKATIVLFPFRAIHKVIKAGFLFVFWAIDTRQEINLRYGKLPKKKRSRTGKAAPMANPPPFLRLPPELRHRIYKLALQLDGESYKGGECVLQPGVGFNNMNLSICGPYPSSWRQGQHIRSDVDPPSKVLPYLLALNGSVKDPFVSPPKRGCKAYASNSDTLCGDESAHSRLDMLHRGKEAGQAASLLLVCRQVYHEVLPILYGENTFSFFGPGIVPFFVRNVGAEGLATVRNVHLALPLDATRWMQSRWKREVTKAIKCINENFAALKQFDVEIILTWGQPKQPELLWRWLMADVFAELGGLDEFVLKTVVARPLSKHKYDRYEYQDWQPETELLSSWSDEDYHRLKLAVTAQRSSANTVE